MTNLYQDLSEQTLTQGREVFIGPRDNIQ